MRPETWVWRSCSESGLKKSKGKEKREAEHGTLDREADTLNQPVKGQPGCSLSSGHQRATKA